MHAHARILTLGMLALLTLGFLPASSGMGSPPGLQCYNFTWDSDKDGHAEPWRACTTAQCGCNCPVVGLRIELIANGQEQSYEVVASCQSGYASGSEDAQSPESMGVVVTPIVYGGGLSPIITTLENLLTPTIQCNPPLC